MPVTFENYWNVKQKLHKTDTVCFEQNYGIKRHISVFQELKLYEQACD